jgi:hypothetical protein
MPRTSGAAAAAAAALSELFYSDTSSARCGNFEKKGWEGHLQMPLPIGGHIGMMEGPVRAVGINLWCAEGIHTAPMALLFSVNFL